MYTNIKYKMVIMVLVLVIRIIHNSGGGLTVLAKPYKCT